jgi:hypothetical protein
MSEQLHPADPLPKDCNALAVAAIVDATPIPVEMLFTGDYGRGAYSLDAIVAGG